MEIISRADARRSGRTRYFTGGPCKHGHAAERYVGSCECCECADKKRARWSGYHAEYRARNRQKARAYNRANYAANAEDMRAYARQYRSENSEQVRKRDAERRVGEAELRRARERERYKNEGERIRERENRRYLKEAARIKARVKKYRVENPDKVRESGRPALAAARARKRCAEGKFVKADINRMLAAQNFICAACPADISKNYHVDHMLPLARGGTNWPDNLQLLCPTCNRSKGAKTMAEWISWKTMLQHRPLTPAPQGR